MEILQGHQIWQISSKNIGNSSRASCSSTHYRNIKDSNSSKYDSNSSNANTIRDVTNFFELNNLLSPSIYLTVSVETKMPSYHPPNFSGFWIFAKLASSLTHKLGRETPKTKFSLVCQTFFLFQIYFGDSLCLFCKFFGKKSTFSRFFVA
jgi:hypothetical protein